MVLWEQGDVFLGQWVVQRVVEIDLRDVDALFEVLEAGVQLAVVVVVVLVRFFAQGVVFAL